MFVSFVAMTTGNICRECSI